MQKSNVLLHFTIENKGVSEDFKKIASASTSWKLRLTVSWACFYVDTFTSLQAPKTLQH